MCGSPQQGIGSALLNYFLLMCWCRTCGHFLPGGINAVAAAPSRSQCPENREQSLLGAPWAILCAAGTGQVGISLGTSLKEGELAGSGRCDRGCDGWRWRCPCPWHPWPRTNPMNQQGQKADWSPCLGERKRILSSLPRNREICHLKALNLVTVYPHPPRHSTGCKIECSIQECFVVKRYRERCNGASGQESSCSVVMGILFFALTGDNQRKETVASSCTCVTL